MNDDFHDTIFNKITPELDFQELKTDLLPLQVLIFPLVCNKNCHCEIFVVK